MKRLVYLVGIAFAISMAAVLGYRMSSDAMAIVVGIFFGMVASIPTSLLLVYALRQRDGARHDLQNPASYRYQPYGGYPPVVVVAPPSQNGYPYSSPIPSLPAPAHGPQSRSFKIVGQENTETLDDTVSPNSLWDEIH
jgi:hypothetical protein